MSSPRLPFATAEGWQRRTRAPHQHEVLAFSLGDEEYGIDIRRLRGIIRTPPITEVPRAPAFVLGVIGVRGEVLPVIDLRLRLRKPRATPGASSRVLIARREDEAFALVVDAVRHVVRLRDDEIEATPALLGAADSEYIAGIARPWPDRLLILLAVDAVLGFNARRSSG